VTAHALSGKTEDGDRRDKKDKVVELPLLLDMALGASSRGIQYRCSGVLVLLNFRSGLDKEAAQVRKISL
jgi:hypothetical protein